MGKKKKHVKTTENVSPRPTLKKIESVERKLPYVFDLYWDIKYEYQILENLFDVFQPDFFRLLAEHGYDVIDLKNKIKQSKEYLNLLEGNKPLVRIYCGDIEILEANITTSVPVNKDEVITLLESLLNTLRSTEDNIEILKTI